jgi:hypothetical protein
MAFNQSGVSGLLGFLTGLDKGKQERRQYQDQTAQMGLQFAKEANESNRQNRAESMQREEFGLRKAAAAQAKTSADQQAEINKLTLQTQTRANDPYNIGLNQRAPVSEAISKLEAGLPDLMTAYSSERTPAKQQAILAKINMVRKEVTRRKNGFRESLSTLGLKPEQIDELMLFGDNPPPQQQQGVPSPTGFNVGAAPQQQAAPSQFSLNAPQQAPSNTPQLPMSSFNRPAASTGFNVEPRPTGPQTQLSMNAVDYPQNQMLGLIGKGAQGAGPSAGQIPGQTPTRLANGNINIDPELSTYLSGLGLSLTAGKDNQLTAEEYKQMLDFFKERNVGGLVSPAAIGKIKTDPTTGLADPNAALPGIDYGKVTVQLMPNIRDSIKATARRMNKTVEEVQMGMIGDDPKNWPLDADGNIQDPADGGAALKSAMIPFITIDPKIINDWTQTQGGMIKDRVASIKDKADKVWEAAEKAKDRANSLAIAKLNKQGQIGAAEKTASATTQSYFSQQINTADDFYQKEYERLTGTLVSGQPTTLEEIGFSQAKTKQRIPIDVAKAIVDSAQSTMIAEMPKHEITNFQNPAAAVNGYKRAKSKSILVSRYEGLRAGVIKQRQKVQEKTTAGNGAPLETTDEDVILLSSLESDMESARLLARGKNAGN